MTMIKIKNYPLVIILALSCTTIVSVAQVLLKIGSAKFSISLDQISNYYLLGGGFLYILGMFLFIWAFRLGELSVVYPVMASGFVIVTFLSVYFLGETITFQKLLGTFLIMTGVIFIGKGGQSEY